MSRRGWNSWCALAAVWAVAGSVFGAGLAAPAGPQQPSGGSVYRLVVADAIGPATAEYVHDGLAAAAASAGARLVVLQMDTPGEFEASKRLVEAAAILATQPQALQLRYLQTLADIGAENNTTIVFPLPLDLIRPLLAQFDRQGGGQAE